MNNPSDTPKIICQPLDSPDFANCHSRYGVEFVPPTHGQIDSMEQICGRLANQHTGLKLTRPAVLYKPAAFLARPLTPAQVIAINHRETAAVANYCLSAQAQLATVPICESLERLVHLPSLYKQHSLAATFSTAPFPDVSGPWAGQPQEFWVRQSFADRLLVLSRLLSTAGAQLHFEEVFRPMGVQEGMFKRRVHRTRLEHPTWDERDIMAEAKSKTAYTPRFSSHKGGAAVDVFLRNVKTLELLNFGHGYPDGGAIVFPRTAFVTADQWSHRQLLQVAAGLSDLTLYVGEDWHLSYGDNLASLDEFGQVRQDYTAIFGPIKNFDRTTGEITSVYNNKELDEMFIY